MSLLESYLDALCDRSHWLWMIFIIATLFLLLSLAFVYALEPGSAGRAISLLNVLSLSAFAAVSGLLIRTCLQR